MTAQPPWCPPLVQTSSGIVGHLLAWQRQESDQSWWAWISWVQQSRERIVHNVVLVQAGSLGQIEEPEAYRDVPRRVHRIDGTIELLAPPKESS